MKEQLSTPVALEYGQKDGVSTQAVSAMHIWCASASYRQAIDKCITCKALSWVSAAAWAASASCRRCDTAASSLVRASAAECVAMSCCCAPMSC